MHAIHDTYRTLPRLPFGAVAVHTLGVAGEAISLFGELLTTDNFHKVNEKELTHMGKTLFTLVRESAWHADMLRGYAEFLAALPEGHKLKGVWLVVV